MNDYIVLTCLIIFLTAIFLNNIGGISKRNTKQTE